MNAAGELVRIGEAARRLGVSQRTIKYYEELGLVQPEARSAGRFRLYGEGDIHRLERILRLKGMGFSLAAIGELLAARDDAEQADRTTVLQVATQRLRQREDEVDQRIRTMKSDLERAEELREDLRRDIALCEQRMREM